MIQNCSQICACCLCFLRDAGQKCPVDNEVLLENQLFPDNFAKREILSLTVCCPNEGCMHKMELRHLEVGQTAGLDVVAFLTSAVYIGLIFGFAAYRITFFLYKLEQHIYFEH